MSILGPCVCSPFYAEISHFKPPNPSSSIDTYELVLYKFYTPTPPLSLLKPLCWIVDSYHSTSIDARDH